jgi:DNA-directed RNA polymerase subunit beta'
MDEMIMAYENKEVGLHAKVKVSDYLGQEDAGARWWNPPLAGSSFNQQIPQDLGFVEDRKGR